MKYIWITYYVALSLLCSSFMNGEDLIPRMQKYGRSSLQATKENLKQAFKTFLQDIKDPRTDEEFERDLAQAKTWEERKPLLRIAMNKTIFAFALTLGISASMLFLFYASIRLGIIQPPISPFRAVIINNEAIRSKLPYLNQRQTTFDIFTILQVNEQSSTADIKKAYKKLALKYHPDKHPGDPIYADVFKVIEEAYSKMKTYRHIN